MSASNLIVYSKRTGVNQLLFQASTNDNSLLGIGKTVEQKFKDEVPFAYVLVDGKEIKLFSV